MGSRHDLDPHAKPPDAIKDIYKKYQKNRSVELDHDKDILDFQRPDWETENIKKIGELPEELLKDIFQKFDANYLPARLSGCPAPIYEHSAMPGLRIIPNLLPPTIQRLLLDRLIHRDLSNREHKTNVHLHHIFTYPGRSTSFFSMPPWYNFYFEPKNNMIHKPVSISQFLNKKLRWITLGGQYDWTNKVYPEDRPPDFPEDLAQLLLGLFPEMQPQAAIVNFYSPGDTLSLHRDVAEKCDRGLVSISIGCDGIFILGLEDKPSTSNGSEGTKKDVGRRCIAVRLRSGDAVFMSGLSRFAWHGVPQIIPDTCPEWLKDWPANGEDYGDWKGWMASKRINLNVRQMQE